VGEGRGIQDGLRAFFDVRVTVQARYRMGVWYDDDMVRFDELCFLVKGAVEYFREHMALGDYLTEKGQAEMTWVGQNAERLGLTGRYQLPSFENLCRGLHPVTIEPV
jgi:hypothetical protein